MSLAGQIGRQLYGQLGGQQLADQIYGELDDHLAGHL